MSTVVNDGVDPVLAMQDGCSDFGDGRGGLDSLRSRILLLDGELEAVIIEDGRFRLHARAPLRRPVNEV